MTDDEQDDAESGERNEHYGLSDRLEKADRRIRIQKLREEARELSGGDMDSWESEDIDDDELAEEFWEQVVDFEKAPWTTLKDELTAGGVALPNPSGVNADEATDLLERIFEELARIRVFLERTNHLSDRELYERLWRDILPEQTKLPPRDPNSAYHLDIIGGGSDDENEIYLKYYASDEERKTWAEQFPDAPLPDHVDPPYDRDARLPSPDRD